MTELLFSEHLRVLTNEEIITLFSVMIYQVKARGEESFLEISPSFTKALVFL
jgi:hypothetical protein